MLRIAVIQRFLPSRSRGGVGHFTHGLCNALAARGHEVTVFSQDPAPEGARYGVVTLPGGRRGGLNLAPVIFPLQVARLDFKVFDVIHAQGDDQLIGGRGDGLPVVRTMHGSSLSEALHNGWRARSPKHLLLHLYFYLWELIADARATAVIGVSADTLRFYPRGHGVIPNGVEVERFAEGPCEKSERPSILFVGQVESRKRGGLLLSVFREHVRPRLPDAELWLVSPEQVAEDGVKCYGSVSDEQLAHLYRRAWVFCLPSSYEGFGRPYVEALAAGTPAVATPNPGAAEVLGQGEYGLIVPDSELGDTLCRLLERDDLRREYEERGRARALDYSWRHVAERYERVYEGVIREGRAAERRSEKNPLPTGDF